MRENLRSKLGAAVLLPLIAAICGTALAQTSASYKLTESVFNGGGDPNQGSVLTSASHHIKLDAIGESLLGVGVTSANYHMDAGFVDVYRPPREVVNLTIAEDKRTLNWSADPSIGNYNLYRNLTSTLPGDFGSCLQGAISDTTATDAATPGVSTSYYYLVTARDRLGEEGTKGFSTNGVERSNSSPCP